MITTKHGQKGKANVTVTADWGIQTLPYKLNTLTGDDYARSIRDSKANDGAGLTNQIWSEAYDGKRNLIALASVSSMVFQLVVVQRILNTTSL